MVELRSIFSLNLTTKILNKVYMKRLIWIVVLLTEAFGFHGDLNATHIIGGEIFYNCQGNDNFKITLKLYRDCLLGQAPFDDPATVSVYNASGFHVRDVQMVFPGSHLVPQQSLSPCFQQEVNVCVEEAVYEQVVNLPYLAGGYTLVYQRCCRNQSILNIFGPGDTGATYTTEIPESVWTNCNSSPRFTQFPPIVLCINDPLIFDHSATDPDGDSLVYSFCDPFEGGSVDDPMPVPAAPPPYNFVNFSAPFNAGNPLPATPAFIVNSSTGLLTGEPTQQGQFVVAVCVTEYRNGQLLSVNKRDFQFNVINCEGQTQADFVAPTADVDLGNVCNGLEVSFQNESENADSYQWDFGISGIITDVSSLVNPIYVYPDTGVYQVLLIANPGNACADTATLTIAVYRKLEAEILPMDPQCIIDNSFDFTAGGFFTPDDDLEWGFNGPVNTSSSTIANPQDIVWAEGGNFMVYLNMSNPHCTSRDSIIVTVYPELNVDFSVNKLNACSPSTLIFTNNSSYSPGAFFEWDFGDGTTSSEANPYHSYSEPGTYDLSLLIGNPVGCKDTAALSFDNYITIRPSPVAALSADPLKTSILMPNVTFFDESTGELTTWLDPGTGEVFQHPETLYYTYADTGWYDARIIALNEVGCYDTAMVPIRIEPLYACFIPNAFTPGDDNLNETFGPKGEGFKHFEMLIFDRWGNVIFTTTEPMTNWDGRANGGNNIAQGGVYNYKIMILDVLGGDHSYTGRVTLIR